MTSRFKTFAKMTAGALAFTGLGVCGVGVYGARQINISRKRWFTDDFVLTPETLRMPYKRVQFATEDNVELSGWLIEQTVKGKPSKRMVMCCNPYFHDKSTLLGIARGLWDSGYSVLLFDFRSHAPKPVQRETIGYLERRDGLAALRWLHSNKPEGSKVGLVGASMGGAVALMLAEEDPASAGGTVVSCATDCAFSNLKDVIANTLHQEYPSAFIAKVPLLKTILLESLCFFNEVWYGYNPADVGPLKFLDKLTVPLLLVHSEQDQVVPVDQAYRIFNGASTPDKDKQLVIVPEVHHIGAYFMHEKEYIRRIVDFLDDTFDRAEALDSVAAEKAKALVEERRVEEQREEEEGKEPPNLRLARHPSLSARIA